MQADDTKLFLSDLEKINNFVTVLIQRKTNTYNKK